MSEIKSYSLPEGLGETIDIEAKRETKRRGYRVSASQIVSKAVKRYIDGKKKKGA